MVHQRSHQAQNPSKAANRQPETSPASANRSAYAPDNIEAILGTRSASRQLKAELQQQQEGIAPESQPMHQLLRSITPMSPQLQTKPVFRGISHEWGAAPSAPVIQPKLTIGAPNDKYEQEADRVAQQVVQRLQSPQLDHPQSGQTVQREVDPEEEDELQMKPMAGQIQRVELADDDELQMKPVSQGGGAIAASDNLESAIQQSRGGGQPLAESIREPMEQAFGGVDFSGVKVHTDERSDQLNRSIQSQAFTNRQDIYFRSGVYEPESVGGQELIAHELTHIVQQQGCCTPSIQKKVDKNLPKGTLVLVNPQGGTPKAEGWIKAIIQNEEPGNDGWTMYTVSIIGRTKGPSHHRINSDSPNIKMPEEGIFESYPMRSQWQPGPKTSSSALKAENWKTHERAGIIILRNIVDLNCGYYCAEALISGFFSKEEQWKVGDILKDPESVAWSPESIQIRGKGLFKVLVMPTTLKALKVQISNKGALVVGGPLGSTFGMLVMKLGGFSHYVLVVDVNEEKETVVVLDPLNVGKTIEIPWAKFIENMDEQEVYYLDRELLWEIVKGNAN